MTAEAAAPAKINLTLHVTGQRADGYHQLDSLVVFAGIADCLTLSPDTSLSLAVSGRFAAGVPTDARNIAWRAAELARWTGHIQIEKNLPHGAGIGGGSADAAAVLRHVMGDRLRDAVYMDDIAALGADVPVCLSDRPQWMSGIGTQLAFAAAIPALNIVMVNPGVTLPTGQVFDGLDSKQNAEMTPLGRADGRVSFVDWLGAQRNDLQAPALRIAPQIAKVLSSLDGALLARMSGSGSTCFGIYPNRTAAQEAAQRIARNNRDWWVQETVTNGSGPS